MSLRPVMQKVLALRQQLEASQKREVMLRDALETCEVGDFSTGHVIYPSFDEKLVNEALAATADIDGLILCEKEPFAWVGMSGHGAIVSMTPPTVQPDLWKQCYIAAKDQWK